MYRINFEEILSIPEESLPVGGIFIDELQDFNFPVVVYGAGQLGERTILQLQNKDIRPYAICDSNSNKIGKDICGYKIMAFEDVMENFSNFNVLIASSFFYEDIKGYLADYISEDRIYIVLDNDITGILEDKKAFRRFIENTDNQEGLNNIYTRLYDDQSRHIFSSILKGKCLLNSNIFSKIQTDKQYFNDITVCSDDFECFIDGGSCDGDTIQEFINFKKNKYKKIYAFEPLKSFFTGLENNKRIIFDNDERIQLLNYGLYDCSRKIGFNSSTINTSSKIDESVEDESISVVSIDEILNEKVTFIKLDIEGSELKALQGAKQTILKYKPKLAICVYHKVDDLLKIPEFIMNLELDYKFYLRHHSKTEIETVFYAV